MSWTANKVFNSGKEFVEWLEKYYSNTVKTVISRVHVHHTYKPDHSNNQSTLQLHKNMRNYHVNTNGWQDIAQHLTIGKDGKIVLGRNILTMPASATGYNGSVTSHPLMFETIGNFDKGHDTLHGAQLDSVLAVCHYINVTKGKPVVFHRECLINGKAPKTCPGSGLDKGKFMKQVRAYKGEEPSSGTVSAPNTQTKAETVNKPTSKPKKTWTKVNGSWTGQTLKYGQYGEPVKQLQTKLAKNDPPFYPNKGAKNNGIDSYYGDDTEDAVRRFQGYYGLDVDGLAGKATYNKLKGKTTASKPKPASKLPNATYQAKKPYPSGSGVNKVQQALASVYYYPNKGAKNNGIDSVYGPNTADAVKRFQSTHGLKAEGIYGKSTRAKLLKVMK